MQDSKKNILSIRAIFGKLKKFFIPWLITSVVVAVAVFGVSTINEFVNRTISVKVNFSFEGIESGHDPLGNKFNVNEIVSEEAVQAALTELNISNADVDNICSSIYISGNIPSDVIERITTYKSMYDTEAVLTEKNIKDTTYYPTQYVITMDCHKVDMKFSDCVNLLNIITENYKSDFNKKYGYNNSLANAVKVFEYDDYDYSNTVEVFDSSLESLQCYISDLAAIDNMRFRSEQTGYTFSDIAKSIEILRTENLEIISSYITLYNMTKNKDLLITSYEYKIDEYERQKKINEEQREAIKSTLEVYEKNSILIFAQATTGADATLTQSSDTYDRLIEMEVAAETAISQYEQMIDKYTVLIDNLKNNTKKGSSDKLEEDFNALNEKINVLLDTVDVTVNEYYENVRYKNAYEILSPASSSTLNTVVIAVRSSFFVCLAIELFVCALYIMISVIITNEAISEKFSKKFNKNDKSKANKRKGGRK